MGEKTHVPLAEGYDDCWRDYERIIAAYHPSSQPSSSEKQIFFFIAYFGNRAAPHLTRKYIGFVRRIKDNRLEDAAIEGVESVFFSICVNRLDDYLRQQNLGILMGMGVPVESLPER